MCCLQVLTTHLLHYYPRHTHWAHALCLRHAYEGKAWDRWPGFIPYQQGLEFTAFPDLQTAVLRGTSSTSCFLSSNTS